MWYRPSPVVAREGGLMCFLTYRLACEFKKQKKKNVTQNTDKAKVRSKLKMERSQLSPIIKEDLKETRDPKTMEPFNVYNGDQNAT